MSCAPTGRIGLRPEISGFVVREDDSLEARIRRSATDAQARILERLLALRERAATGTGDPEKTESSETAPAPAIATDLAEEPAAAPEALQAEIARAFATQEQPADPPAPVEIVAPKRDWRRILKLHLAAALIRGNQLRILAMARLRPGDRLRDAAALAWPATKWCLRRALVAPRWVKVIALVSLGLYLAPWPDAPQPDPALAAPAPEIAAPSPRMRDIVEGWRPVPANLSAYHLEAPELDRGAFRYRMRSQPGGGRQDVMSWNEDGGEKPKNRFSGVMSIEHYPAGQPGAETLFVDVARRAAWHGLGVEKISDAFALRNKFGQVEAAEAVLSQGSSERACLVFRHVAEDAPVQLHGWFCGGAQRPLDRATLACLVDRIDLLGAGGDRTLKSWFAAIERQRRACGAYPPVAAPTGWVDAGGRIPELKAAFRDLPRRGQD